MLIASKVKLNLILIVVLILLVSLVFLIYLDMKYLHPEFTFAMLDIGQGDAIFVESPAGTQLLIDSGPPRKILGALRKVMSPFDRSIDAIIITNPDQDHIGGFADILNTYKVGMVFEPGTYNNSATYKNLKSKVSEKNLPVILARRGMKLDLGGDTSLLFLFPDRDVSTWTTNDGSVVGKLNYGGNSFMLMGDATSETERVLLEENSARVLKSETLKVGHHGSRTSTSEEFARAVSPTRALISVGKDNKYGHPHAEILDTLAKIGAEVLRTDEVGSIIVKSPDGVLRWSYER